MTTNELKAKWNSLTNQQKAAFGDMYITHETNLKAWAKNFDDLSPLKQDRVLKNIENVNPDGFNNVLGYGIN